MVSESSNRVEWGLNVGLDPRDTLNPVHADVITLNPAGVSTHSQYESGG